MPCVPKTYCLSLPPTTCSIPPRCGHRSSWSQLVSSPHKCPPISPLGFPLQSHPCCNSVKNTPICPPIESPIVSCIPKPCSHSPPYPPAACCLPQPCGRRSSCATAPPVCPPKCPPQSLTYFSSVKKTSSCPPIKSKGMPCAPKTCCHSLPYPPATCCLPPPCGPRSSCHRLASSPPKCPAVSRPRNC